MFIPGNTRSPKRQQKTPPPAARKKPAETMAQPPLKRSRSVHRDDEREAGNKAEQATGGRSSARRSISKSPVRQLKQEQPTPSKKTPPRKTPVKTPPRKTGPAFTSGRSTIAPSQRPSIYSLAATAGRMSLFSNASTLPPPMSHFSTPSAPASSSVFPFASVKQGPENRQLDKAAVARMAQRICRFLDTSQPKPTFEYAEEKIRNNGTKRDFAAVFTHIYRCADPKFEFNKDLLFEQEVSSLLGSLGYPYSVPKQLFNPVGAPHSWKFLLAALCWLIDAVGDGQRMTTDYEISKETAVLQYSAHCYREAREAKGESGIDYNLALEDYRQMAEERDGLSSEELHKLKQRREMTNGTLKQLKNDLEQEIDETGAVERELGNIESDIKALRDYSDKLIVQMDRLNQVTDEQTSTIKHLGEELAAATEKNQQKEVAITAQPVSGEQVRKLNADRKNLAVHIEATRAAAEKSDKLYYELQPKAFQVMNELRSHYKSFTMRLRELCAQMLNGEKAAQVDWTICDQQVEQVATDEFISRSSNDLFEMIAQLKSLLEGDLAEMHRAQHEILLRAEEKDRQLSQTQSDQVQLERDNSLKLEQLKRGVRDATSEAKEAGMKLELARVHHKRCNDNLAELLKSREELLAEVGEEEGRQIEMRAKLRQMLENVYASMTAKLHALRDFFNMNCRHKQMMLDLAHRIIAANQQSIAELRNGTVRNNAADQDPSSEKCP